MQKHKKHKSRKVFAIMCVSYLIMAACALLHGRMPIHFTIAFLIVSGVVFITSGVVFITSMSSVNDALLEDYHDEKK